MSLRSHSPTISDQYRNLLVTSISTSTSSLSMWPSNYARIKFSDFVDLQTRLVLLPRVEEEGVGAVIASLQDVPKEIELPHQETDEPSQEVKEMDKEISNFVGYSFVGLESQQEDWSDKEFTDILTLLRQVESTSLTLVFAPPRMEGEEQQSDKSHELHDKHPTSGENQTSSTPQSECDIATINSPQPQPLKVAVPSQESLQAGISVLSSWGMRMRAQASEAASTLSTVAIERAKTFQNPVKQVSDGNIKKSCDIFIQTSVGAFVPAALAHSKVTTTSILFVRKSATEPAPRSGWSFQWYRSSTSIENLMDENASVASDASRSSTSSSGATPEAAPPAAVDEINWVLLEGATTAAFQPDATIIGRKLRCLVTIDHEEPSSSDDSSDGSDSVAISQEICEITGVVAADPTLFNAARQALVRGAKFGGLKGRGNAAGRLFRVEVSIGMPSRKHCHHTTSSLQIFQMSGQESISLTASPLLYVSGRVPACSPKFMDLQIAVPAESVLSALCTDGMFQLEAPNRLTRESFLMTLGIANFVGKPAQLDSRTILFKDRPLEQLPTLLDDDASMSSESCASTVRDQRSLSHCPVSPVLSVTMPGTPTNSGPATPDRSYVASPTSTTLSPSNTYGGGDNDRMSTLEQELSCLKSKLARKDKIISELQRQLAKSDSAHETTQKELSNCRQELKQCQVKQESLSETLEKTEGYVKSHENKLLRLEGDHAQKVATMECHIESQNKKIADLEKANRSLQNEKAVLQAAVEARESKLTRMAELQSSYDELSVKVAQHDALRNELEASYKRHEEIQEDLRKVETIEKECREELSLAKRSIQDLTVQVDRERKRSEFLQSQLDPVQKEVQQLKGERNSYKHKNESLSKELARICKNGRTVKDIEKVLADFDALMDEVETLRKQKRKALEDAHTYRTSYAQSRAAQEIAGVEKETQAALERNAELERLLVETTEYINAQQMQLETMKLVNEQLQEEIRTLAKANLGKNEV